MPHWDFGGGASPLDAVSPGAVAFAVSGTYTVTYTCKDATGALIAPAQTVVVHVNDVPVASITSPSGPVSIATGDSVSFSGVCTDADTPLTYAWSFAGGASGVDGGAGGGGARGFNSTAVTVGLRLDDGGIERVFGALPAGSA